MDEDRLISPISPETAVAALRERLPTLAVKDIVYLGGGSMETLHIGPAAADFCLWRGAYGPTFLGAMLATYHRPVDEHFRAVMDFCYNRIPLIYFRHGFTQHAPVFVAFGRMLLRQRMVTG